MIETAILILAILAGVIAHPATIQIDAGDLADWVSGLGSLAAVIVALLGFRVVANQRAADKRDAEKGVAYELVATVLDMGNHIRAIEKHLNEQRNDMVVKIGEKVVAKFRVLNPLIGLSNEGELKLPIGSTELMFKAGAVELWNDVRLLANRNRSLTSLLKDYQQIWQGVIDQMPTPEGFTGTVGHIAADPAAFDAVRGDLVRVDSVIEALDAQVKDTGKLLTRVAGQIGPVMKKYFDEPFLHLGDPDKAAASRPAAV